MKNELIIRKCKKCGAMVKEIIPCNCEGKGIKCCDEEMEVLVPNTTDAAVEKHVPTYEKMGDKIKVTVKHVMEDEHYIEWIALVTDKEEIMVKLKPGEEAECTFEYVPGSTLYAYCNKHNLWKKDVE